VIPEHCLADGVGGAGGTGGARPVPPARGTTRCSG